MIIFNLIKVCKRKTKHYVNVGDYLTYLGVYHHSS